MNTAVRASPKPRLIQRLCRAYAVSHNENTVKGKGKGKAVPLQAWSGLEVSRKLRFPDFMTTAQGGGKVVSLMHRPHLPQEILLVPICVRG